MVLDTIELADAAAWRAWLRRNHLRSSGVWLVFGSLSYDEALDEALAWGWIDSLVRRLDAARHARKFTPRRPWSLWSARNIARVRKLTRARRMTRWGLAAFAKRTSRVSDMERVNAEGAKVPKDLQDALRRHKKAWASFQGFAPSHRKRYVIWITSAKRPETRERRIAEAVTLIARGVKDLLK